MTPPPPKLADDQIGPVKQARWRKAQQFADAAELVFEYVQESFELGDAFVTLAVHSGIASSDVICIAARGEYHTGEDHNAAAAMLQQVDAEAAKHLRRLLKLKTKAGYSDKQVSADDVRATDRAYKHLLERAAQVR